MPISLTQAIGNPVPITTGATTFQANPLVQVYAITTGGTGGVEVINLPNHSSPLANMVGRRVTFFIATRTNASDSIKISVNGSDTFSVITPIGLQTITTGALINFVGGTVSFVWRADKFVMDRDVTSATDSTTVTPVTLVQSNTTGITGADQITNIVSLTQAEYDAIGSPSATTLYVIVG